MLEKSISDGEKLIETVSDGVDALRRYMHAALDNGIGAINIIRPLLQEPDWPDLRTRAGTLMKKLMEGAERSGALRDDLSERDIVFALTRFARPLALGLPVGEERALAHRHLDFYIDGLCVGPSQITRSQPPVHRTVFADHSGEPATPAAGLQRRKAHKVQAPGST